MPKTNVDILIVGGGIFGCGILQAVSACGYNSLLVEQHRLASGTSSQSTKLIHGGLRYLEQLNFKLVYEALHERELLLKNAPDLVHREWFYIPVYKGSKRPPWLIALGLWFYFILSRGRSRFKRLPKSEWSRVLPDLTTKGLKAVFAYQDAATDDAELTRAVAASAVEMGGLISENTAVLSAVHDGTHWQVQLSTGELVTAKVLVNAAGPWVNLVRNVISPQPPSLDIQWVQGSHLVLNRPCSVFVYTESLNGRVMFFRPWQNKTLVGTTEKVFDGNPSEVMASDGEINEILQTFNDYFPSLYCQKTDIVGVYCGLRVLPLHQDSAFGASRETVILCDNGMQPTYLAVYGGKLTTYRKESEKVLRLIMKTLQPEKFHSTEQVKLTPTSSGT